MFVFNINDRHSFDIVQQLQATCSYSAKAMRMLVGMWYNTSTSQQVAASTSTAKTTGDTDKNADRSRAVSREEAEQLAVEQDMDYCEIDTRTCVDGSAVELPLLALVYRCKCAQQFQKLDPKRNDPIPES